VTVALPKASAARRFLSDVAAWVADFEARYSVYRADSLISRINAAAGRGWVEIDRELDRMLTLCDWYHWLTGGVFDPTSRPLAVLWDYHGPSPVVPADGAVQAARALVGWRRVRRAPGRVYLPEAGMALELGGFGKEYAVDRVTEMARQAGAHDVLIDFGQDVRVAGQPPEGGLWRIGLQDPYDPGRCWGGVGVTDRAVATSGDYHRGFDAGGVRYGHVVDPRTGYPTRNGCQAASVVAATCTEAGVLAKAAMILGPEEGVALLARCQQAQGCLWVNGRRYETGRFNAYVLRTSN
jgi:thiamine biosynthesis lipoprotein